MEKLSDEKLHEICVIGATYKQTIEIAADLLATRTALAELQQAIENIRDIARTGVAPDAFSMTQEEWNAHKINKIAREATIALESLPQPPEVTK